MSIHQAESNDTALSELAYAAVRSVPTVEPNDRNRLGYHVWLFLRGEIPTLLSAIEQARARYQPRSLPIEDVIAHIEAELKQLQSSGMSVSEKGSIASH
jgi:hypothetical protein